MTVHDHAWPPSWVVPTWEQVSWWEASGAGAAASPRAARVAEPWPWPASWPCLAPGQHAAWLRAIPTPCPGTGDCHEPGGWLGCCRPQATRRVACRAGVVAAVQDPYKYVASCAHLLCTVCPAYACMKGLLPHSSTAHSQGCRVLGLVLQLKVGVQSTFQS